jgi:hypothetical protein
VLSVLTYSVGKSHDGQVLICKAVNVAASSGVQTSITFSVIKDLQFHTNDNINMNNIKHHSLDAHVRIKSTEFQKCMYKTKKKLTISVIELLLLVSN